MKKIKLGEIAAQIGAQLHGNPETYIEGIGVLNDCRPGLISFLDNPVYRKYLSETKASAVILTRKEASHCSVDTLIVDQPYLAYAKVAALFFRAPFIEPGIHHTAIIAEGVNIDPSASIGARVCIAKGVTIGPNVIIHPGVVIAEDCEIGEDTILWANVTLYYRVKIGKRCQIHSGAVIGADGFGFAKAAGYWHRVAQLGSVSIGDDVDIGANTTIDRGAIENTVIGNDVKLDNQIQIGHNVRIGDHTAIAGCTAVAGSAHIGSHCLIGGGVGIAGHLELADNICLTAFTGVNNSIKEPGIYSSGMIAQPRNEWRKNVIRMRQLDQMARRIQELEKKLIKSEG